MRPLSTFLLLSILAFASACSKSNYAQVEPDDLYFTHKDRKASQANYSASTSTSTVDADASYNAADTDVSSYTNQHSPTLQSTTLGSPTIQQYEEPFYDASQNPDYLLGQELENAEGVSDAYYMEDYASYNTDAVAVQTVNNYYGYDGYGYNPYYSSGYSSWGYPSSSYYNPFSFSIGFGYSPYGYGYNPYRRYSYASYYGYGYYDNYYSGYPYYYSSSSFCYYPNNYYNNNSNYYNDVDYANANQVVNGPRKSRSSVSYYANKENYNIKRRDNYIPGNEGGRIIGTESNSRFTATDGNQNSDYVNRRNSRTSNVANRQAPVTQSSGTIQRNSNTVRRYKTNTVSRPVTNTRSRGTVDRNSPTKRQTRTYVNQSENRRTSNVSRSSNRNTVNNNSGQTSRSRYTTPSSSNSNNSYRRNKTNSSSRSSYTPSRSSSSKSSYTPSRSSSSKSSYTPSRSSSSRSRSYSAPRSTPSRSSGTRSSGSSSRSSTSKSSTSKRRQ